MIRRIIRFVGNEENGRISKQVLQENKASQIFRKNEHFLTSETRMYVCVSGIKKYLLSEKFGVLWASLTGVSRKQSMPNFPKSDHFLASDTQSYVCVSEGKKSLLFGKFLPSAFNTRSEIQPFALLPTNYALSSIHLNRYKTGFKFILMLAEYINLNPDRKSIKAIDNNNMWVDLPLRNGNLSIHWTEYKTSFDSDIGNCGSKWSMFKSMGIYFIHLNG